MNDYLPDIGSPRIPLRCLANLLTTDKETSTKPAPKRMLTVCVFMCARHVDGMAASAMLAQAGLTTAQAEEMYRCLTTASYEDRFVIPTTRHEYAENAFDLYVSCSFSFGNGCSDGISDVGLFSLRKSGRTILIRQEPRYGGSNRRIDGRCVLRAAGAVGSPRPVHAACLTGGPYAAGCGTCIAPGHVRRTRPFHR